MRWVVTILSLVLFVNTCSAQDEWYTSVQPGNIRIYTTGAPDAVMITTEIPYVDAFYPLDEVTDTVSVVTINRMGNYGAGTVELMNILGRAYPNGEYITRVKRRNGIVAARNIEYLDAAYYPQFIAKLPKRDTVYDFLENEVVLMRNFRTFDTLVYGKLLPAFSYTWESKSNLATVIVAKPIGIVRLIDQRSDREWYLSSAVIGGESFNRDTTVFRSPRFCDDYTAVLSTTHDEQRFTPHSDTITIRDTVIGGVAYKQLSEETGNVIGGNPIHYTGFTNIFRYQDNNVVFYHNGIEYPIADVPVSLGYYRAGIPSDLSWLSYLYIVSDTGRIIVEGQEKRTVEFLRMGQDMANGFNWVEDYGVTYRSNWNYATNGHRQYLASVVNCGQDIVVTGIDSPPAAPSSPRIFSAPYPNPVSLGQGSITLTGTQQLTQPVHITISDVLGRKLSTLRLEPTGPGTALRIPLRDIGPGLYYLSLNGATFSETTKLVVVK